MQISYIDSIIKEFVMVMKISPTPQIRLCHFLLHRLGCGHIVRRDAFGESETSFQQLFLGVHPASHQSDRHANLQSVLQHLLRQLAHQRLTVSVSFSCYYHVGVLCHFVKAA